MLKGGYLIIDLENLNLIPEESYVPDEESKFYGAPLYFKILNNYRKTILLSGIVIDGKQYSDLIVSFFKTDYDSIITTEPIYGYYFVFEDNGEIYITANKPE